MGKNKRLVSRKLDAQWEFHTVYYASGYETIDAQYVSALLATKLLAPYRMQHEACNSQVTVHATRNKSRLLTNYLFASLTTAYHVTNQKENKEKFTTVYY